MINIIFGILGIAGGVLCAVGDILFDLKGKGNKKLGTSGNIDRTGSICRIGDLMRPYWLLF